MERYKIYPKSFFRHRNGVNIELYNAKRGIPFSPKIIFIGVKADPNVHKQGLLQMVEEITEALNQDPFLNASNQSEYDKNEILLDPSTFLDIQDDATVADFLGTEEAIRLLKILHNNALPEAFGRNFKGKMAQFFKPNSLNPGQVRTLTAHKSYWNAECFKQLEAAKQNK